MDIPKFAHPTRQSVVVVGVGAFGEWSSLQLAEKGAKVTITAHSCSAIGRLWHTGQVKVPVSTMKEGFGLQNLCERNPSYSRHFFSSW